MAKFNEAYLLTGHNEGGYANNPNDHGGETYAGIARNFWPAWTGWAIIDKAKSVSKTVPLINQYAKNNGIDKFVASFYEKNFWDVNRLDLINDQQLANNVYDFGVNSGTPKAAKTLQTAVGTTTDGIIGQATLNAVNSGDAITIYNRYNELRSEFYHSLAKNPGQLQFLKSWMSRIKPYKI